MDNLDIILLLLIFVPGIWNGMKKGFIYQVITLVSLVLGIIVSIKSATALCTVLAPLLKSIPPLALNVISFVLIFIIVYLGLYVLGMLLKRIARDITGGWLDKVLGIALGVAKFALIIGFAILLVNGINAKLNLFDGSAAESSKVYRFLLDMTDKVFPFIKNFFSTAGRSINI